MGRKADQLPEVIEANINHEQLASDVVARDESTWVAKAMDDAMAAGIDLGRLEAMDFIATVANSSILAIYENVKKSKTWMLMRNPKNCHGGNFESLEEFCEVKLGKSYRRLQTLLANKRTVGEEAFEQAEKLGLRQVDYNAIRALPAPKQEIIKEALTEGADIETVTRALRQLAAEDQKEIEALNQDKAKLEKSLRESNANLEIKEQQIASKDMKLNELDAKLFAKHTLDPQEVWTDKMRLVFEMVSSHKQTAVETITALDVIREKAFQLTIDNPGEEAALARAQHEVGMELMQALERIEQQIAGVRRSFDCTLGALIGE